MQRLCTTIAIFLLMISSVNAQFDPNKVDKKAAQLYSKALELAQGDEFVQSIQVLRNAIKIDPLFEDAYLSMAGMFGQLKVYDSAILYYEKARSIDAAYFQDYNLPYSINLAGKGRFEDALRAVDTFLSIPNLNESSVKAGSYRKKTYEFAIDYGKNNPISNYTFAPKNLGDSVNSETSEYYPTLTIDGKQLIFTRRVDHMNEDFYGSDLAKDGKWAKAKLLGGNINSNLNEGAQNISLDGKWLVFTGCNFPEGYGSCDLYISYLTPTGWSFPENLGGKVNTEDWESAPSLSPDKRDLYFASRRPDGYGGSDIYVCHLLPNGKFGQPENLGPTINTIGDESCPFIHADNQTLYFTSNGHPGYGDDDLFMARKGPKGQWSTPKNLGFPINTIEKEGSLVITADGKTAYYASDRSDSKGGLDLYTFEMRNDVRPIKTLWVKGKVFDAKTNNGLPSAVELTNLSTREVVSKIQTDETGNYLITLPIGRDYAFNVNRKGYLFYSENFSFVQKSPDSTYNIDIPLQPLEANASIVLKNIFFDVNKTELKPESQVELNNVVQLMKDNPTLKIQINGHTDNVGKAADNLKLSNGRAESVVAYITSKGITADRLSSKGFGATQPVDANDTEEGRAKNRRTELKVLSTK
ncbi:OmpA family protein [Pinibacter soli]|uniref:OmpA family protein n=1 Tax=Pinibacter soli TaxID=3044211 RepID=A0ABT6RBU5_9BACT|nr:OmpA family protein [Pinibacter soli]MDI3320029.1 OmpA family protein [Pinibacter soli]